MLGRVDKPDAMLRVGEKRGATALCWQNSGVAFLPQFGRVTQRVGHPAHEGFRLMRVELIGDENPWVIRRGSDGLCELRHKVRLRAGCTQSRGQMFSGRHFEIGGQALRAVAHVFVFLSFARAGLTCHTRSHRFGRRGTLQRLEAGLFLGAHQVNPLRVQLWGLFVEVAHWFDLRANFFGVARWRVEPIRSSMGFEDSGEIRRDE